MTATKKRKRRPAAKRRPAEPNDFIPSLLSPLLKRLGYFEMITTPVPGQAPTPTLPSPAPVQMLPITVTPPFAAQKTTRQEIATVVCQAIRAAGLRPTMCDECSSLHLNAAGDRPSRPDELTPSVRRACRLMPQEIISAWQDAV